MATPSQLKSAAAVMRLRQPGESHDFSQVSCGAEHSFALSTTGELYSWGINFKGQCGLQDFENRCRPTLVKNMSPSFHESGQHDEIMNRIAEQQRLQK